MNTLQQSIDKFRDDPASARTRPTVTASLANGHARLSAGPFNWDADLPPVVGGGNQAPSPTAYLLGALAGCAVAFLNDTLAPEFDVEIEDVAASVSCSADLAGLLGMEDHDPALKDLRVEIRIDSPSPDERVATMQEAWKERCPIYLALRDPQNVDLIFAGTQA